MIWTILIGVVLLISLLALFYINHWAVRCPFCKESLYPKMKLGNGWFIYGDFKTCPYCAQHLDVVVDDTLNN